jgi:NAD(P)-dependent dehydrogenase (short-subunit alcohol dehydrogenase family)
MLEEVSSMLISKGTLTQETLEEEIAVVTGAGRGIGYEAAKALVWLGAKVVIAEIDEKNGRAAEENINREFGAGKALFVKTDMANEMDIDNLAEAAIEKFGKVDIVLNNATVFPIGAVKDMPLESWDFSYHVNLRGPVALARKFLPAMIERNHGVFVCVSSSGAAPYMGAYEVFKTAQVELSNTLAAELEGTEIYAFTIGPGISKTPGFIEGGGKVATFMRVSLDELFELNKNAQISPEEAGTGFAIAIATARKYHGQEISSIQVLREAGIPLANQVEDEFKEPKRSQKPQAAISSVYSNRTIELYQAVLKTYLEQSEGWKKRNLFERQWIGRDFKKITSMSIDEMQAALKALGNRLKTMVSPEDFIEPLNQLSAYYEHQKELLKGFEKISKKQEENSQIIDGWITDVKALIQKLSL